MEDEKKRIFFTNLLLLDFDPVAMSQKHRIDFNRDMFDKPNKLGLYEIIHFLLKKLDSQRWNNEFKNLLQVKEKKIEAEFKKMASTWLTDLAKADPTSNLPHLINIFSKPYGSKLYSFLVNLTSFIIRHDLQTTFKKSAYQDYVWPLSETESSYNLLKMACSDVSYRHINRMKQFTDMQADWMQISEGLAEKYRRNINREKYLEEGLRQFEELGITVKELEDKENIIGERINKIRKSMEKLKKLERVMKINADKTHNITCNTLYDDGNTVNYTNVCNSAYQISKDSTNSIYNKNNIITNDTDGQWWKRGMVVVDGNKLSCNYHLGNEDNQVPPHDHKLHLIEFLKQCNKSLETTGKLMQHGTDHKTIEDTLQQINCRLKHHIKLSTVSCANKMDAQIPHLKSSIDALNHTIPCAYYKSMDLPLLDSTTYRAPRPTTLDNNDNTNSSTKQDNTSNDSNKDSLCIDEFFFFESLLKPEYTKQQSEKMKMGTKKHLQSATDSKVIKQSRTRNDDDVEKCKNTVFDNRHEGFENNQVNENKSIDITAIVTTTNNKNSSINNNNCSINSNAKIFDEDNNVSEEVYPIHQDINMNHNKNDSFDDDVVKKNDEDFNMLRFGREVDMMRNSFELHKMNSNIKNDKDNYAASNERNNNPENYNENIINHDSISGITHSKDNNDDKNVSSTNNESKNINAVDEIFNSEIKDNVLTEIDDWLGCDVVSFNNDDGADLLLVDDDDNKDSQTTKIKHNTRNLLDSKDAVQKSIKPESITPLYISNSKLNNITATNKTADSTVHKEVSSSLNKIQNADEPLIDFNTPKINKANHNHDHKNKSNIYNNLCPDLDTEIFETILPTDFEEFSDMNACSNAASNKNNDVSNTRRLSKLRINSDLDFFIENHFSNNIKDIDMKDNANNDDGGVLKEGIADVSLIDLEDFDELNLL